MAWLICSIIYFNVNHLDAKRNSKVRVGMLSKYRWFKSYKIIFFLRILWMVNYLRGLSNNSNYNMNMNRKIV